MASVPRFPSVTNVDNVAVRESVVKAVVKVTARLIDRHFSFPSCHFRTCSLSTTKNSDVLYIPDPLSLLGVGSGHETILESECMAFFGERERSNMEETCIASSLIG